MCIIFSDLFIKIWIRVKRIIEWTVIVTGMLLVNIPEDQSLSHVILAVSHTIISMTMSVENGSLKTKDGQFDDFVGTAVPVSGHDEN